jgi:hypothetical protein
MGGLCSTHFGGVNRTNFGLKTEGKRSVVRSRRRLEDDIKMDLRGMELEDWTGLMWIGIGTGGGSSEHSNESFGFINAVNFVTR